MLSVATGEEIFLMLHAMSYYYRLFEFISIAEHLLLWHPLSGLISRDSIKMKLGNLHCLIVLSTHRMILEVQKSTCVTSSSSSSLRSSLRHLIVRIFDKSQTQPGSKSHINLDRVSIVVGYHW